MKTNKELFKAFINKEITSEELRHFALYATDKIPEYFWTIPASASGKYHPVTDLGEGGLVRHSLMVARIAIDMLNATNNSNLLNARDEILFACLFHDCCKNGIENSGHTEYTHPLIAGQFLRETKRQYQKDICLGFDSDFIEDVIILIITHMGKWTTSKYSNERLPVPMFEDEIFVHQCDYIASRIYCLFDEEFFEKY